MEDKSKNEQPKQDKVDEIKSQPPKQKSSNDEFKRKYFEYYDDIKISDRQDW